MNTNHHQRIANAISDAKRFIARAQDTINAKDDWDKQPRAKNAAMKRASMDLTKSLAELRKGDWR